MTTYIEIPAQKRNFIIPADLPERDTTARVFTLDDNTYVSRNGDTYTAKNNDVYVTRNILTCYPRIIYTSKRNFIIPAEVKNG